MTSTMTTKKKLSDDRELLDYIEKAQIAAERGRLKALKLHKAFGVPIVTEKDGKIVEIPADEKLAEAEAAYSLSPGDNLST